MSLATRNFKEKDVTNTAKLDYQLQNRKATPQHRRAVFEKRLAAFRQRMAVAGTEAILILKGENRAYLTGFEGSAGVLLITSDLALLMVDFRYLEQAKQQAPHVQIMQYGQPLSASLRRVFIDLNLKTVSFEQDYITWEQYEIWENKLGDLVEFLPLPDLTLKLRMLKGPEEIALIRKAAQIADQAFLEVLPLLRSGISERDFAIELEYAMRRGRAQGMAFETIVASGPRAALPHGIASERIIQPGELVIIDFGAIYQGYCSDCTRTVCVGAATPKQQEIYALVEKAQDTALKALCPGITAAELDALARQVISEKGYGENFGHSLGHGVGRLVHEEPTLGSKDQTVIEAGMVVTIEPGIYLPGWGGVRLEELVLVTDIGYEILTRCAKGLTLAAD